VATALIENNEFVKNGVVTATTEIALSTPYFNYLLSSSRSSVYFDPESTCLNEFSFVETCRLLGYVYDYTYI